jgi:hypothetical protein
VADDQSARAGGGEKAMKRVVSFSVCLAITTAASAAEVGRLFFTPAERAQLDVARTHKKAPPPPATQAAETAPPEVVTYGGIVRRSDGKALLWINNRLADESEALGALKGRVRADGAVTLQAPQSGGTVDVKVGQSVDLQSGHVSEGHRLSFAPKASPSDAGRPPSGDKTAETPSKTTATEGTGKKPAIDPKPDPVAPAEKPRPSGDVANR